MPFTREDGSVVATIKDSEGKRDIVIIEAQPAKRKKKRREDGMPTGGRMNLVLTDDGAKWVQSEMAKGADVRELVIEIGVDARTLYNETNGPKFTRAVKEGAGLCNKRLRKAQVTAALNGNSTMLIWLGKNRLGQSDHPEEDQEATTDDIWQDAYDEAERETDKESRPR